MSERVNSEICEDTCMKERIEIYYAKNAEKYNESENLITKKCSQGCIGCCIMSEDLMISNRRVDVVLRDNDDGLTNSIQFYKNLKSQKNLELLLKLRMTKRINNDILPIVDKILKLCQSGEYEYCIFIINTHFERNTKMAIGEKLKIADEALLKLKFPRIVAKAFFKTLGELYYDASVKNKIKMNRTLLYDVFWKTCFSIKPEFCTHAILLLDALDEDLVNHVDIMYQSLMHGQGADGLGEKFYYVCKRIEKDKSITGIEKEKKLQMCISYQDYLKSITR